MDVDKLFSGRGFLKIQQHLVTAILKVKVFRNILLNPRKILTQLLWTIRYPSDFLSLSVQCPRCLSEVMNHFGYNVIGYSIK